MGVRGRRKCRNCKQLFKPEPRSRKRQRYCSEAECRKASKAASQERWLNKPENRGYFQGPEQVSRVRDWRAQHPGYWKRKRGTLQDISTPVFKAQATVKTGESSVLALQELFSAQPLVMIGLIANIAGTALQDDIAFVGRKLLRLGQDVVAGVSDAAKKGIVPGEIAVYPPTIQLGGPATGP